MLKLIVFLIANHVYDLTLIIFMISINTITRAILSAGGKPVLVGGSIRDQIMGITSKDFDIEVYKLSKDELEFVLRTLGPVQSVGKNFGVFKLFNFDISLPRLENKCGSGHKGFMVQNNHNLTFDEAAKRRDFTINSMGIDLETGRFLDPYNGRDDIKTKTLKAVSDSFAEDPLRVLRACQFAARFQFRIHPDTVKLCLLLNRELETLPKERVGEEFKKILNSDKPSIGLRALKETNSIILFPELQALINCPQDQIWHPEGDVWTHTLMVVDEAANLSKSLTIRLGALCHDFGKPKTTKFENGHWRSRNHEAEGVESAHRFLQKLSIPDNEIFEIKNLVQDHLKPFQLYQARNIISNSAIKRLSVRVNIKNLCLIAKADFLGRSTVDAKNRYDPSVEWLFKKANELNVETSAPKKIIMGRDLLNLGFKPGPCIGKLLKEAYNAQLDGKFSDKKEGLEWIMQSEFYLNKYAKLS